MIHLWVDPLYGDDAGATSENPPGPAPLACSASEVATNDVLDPNQNNAPLLHTSWPFKTITGAVAWLRNKFGAHPLPAHSQTTQVLWEHCIIHLLPGVYAPSDPTYGDNYHENGIAVNQETYPIHLPDRVSIQGTSALNTILDPVGRGPVFEFGVTATVMVNGQPEQEEITGAGTFIDSVSITGALLGTSNQPRDAAAILLDDQVSTSEDLTISNCFLFQNSVAIMIVASLEENPLVTHSPIIANDTIAFNRIGVWNGQISSAMNFTAVGWSTPVLLNNILDPGPSYSFPSQWCYRPHRWTYGGATVFEGIGAADMQAAGVDYNAYPRVQVAGGIPGLSWFNQGIQIFGVLPPTTVRSNAGSPQPDVTRDISDIIGDSSAPQTRGILYIRDLLCNGMLQNAFAAYPDWDQSPHDFRLSPGTTHSGTPHQDPGSGSANPNLKLVDNGWAGPFPVTFSNGRTLTRPPGYLVLPWHQETWGFSAWDHDCEGYGNLRIIDHPAYANGSSDIDIGADEVGINVVAGYRYGTTLFLSDDEAPGVQMDNKYQWFLGPPPAQAAAVPTDPQHLVPHMRLFTHLGPLSPNYDFNSGTLSLAWWAPWSFGPITAASPPYYWYYQPTVADITPHLLIDPHPWWQSNPTTAGFACNPVWQYCQTASYNASLYLDPLAPVANPPGTYRPSWNTNLFEWLDESVTSQNPTLSLAFFGNSTGQPGVRDYGGPLALTVSAPGDTGFDAWCRGFEYDMSTGVTYNVNTFPSTIDVNSPSATNMVRFSVENFMDNNGNVGWGNDPSIRNVQSFGILVK